MTTLAMTGFVKCVKNKNIISVVHLVEEDCFQVSKALIYWQYFHLLNYL